MGGVQPEGFHGILPADGGEHDLLAGQGTGPLRRLHPVHAGQVDVHKKNVIPLSRRQKILPAGKYIYDGLQPLFFAKCLDHLPQQEQLVLFIITQSDMQINLPFRPAAQNADVRLSV